MQFRTFSVRYCVVSSKFSNWSMEVQVTIGNHDRPTGQPTDQPANRDGYDVTLPITNSEVWGTRSDIFITLLKGPAHSKNENLYFLVPAQTKRMQPIFVSCEAPFRRNLQKTTGPLGRELKYIFHCCYAQAL